MNRDVKSLGSLVQSGFCLNRFYFKEGAVLRQIQGTWHF